MAKAIGKHDQREETFRPNAYYKEIAAIPLRKCRQLLCQNWECFNTVRNLGWSWWTDNFEICVVYILSFIIVIIIRNFFFENLCFPQVRNFLNFEVSNNYLSFYSILN